MSHSNTRRAASALTLSFFCLALSGCGGPNLKAEIPNGVTLAGQWRLDARGSDDPRALLFALNQKFAKREMRHAAFDEDDPFGPGPMEGSGAPGGGGGHGGGGHGGAGGQGSEGAREGGQSDNRSGPGGESGRSRGIGNFLRSRYGAALGERLGSDALTIEQSPDRFVIVRGDSRRSYTPGGHSVVSVENGVADQTSGWKGREYLIDVRPQVGPHLTERFGLTADGRLIEKVSLSEDGLPGLEFTRMYERGEAPPRGLPTSN